MLGCSTRSRAAQIATAPTALMSRVLTWPRGAVVPPSAQATALNCWHAQHLQASGMALVLFPSTEAEPLRDVVAARQVGGRVEARGGAEAAGAVGHDRAPP